MRTHLHDKLANPIPPFQIQERSPAAFKTHCHTQPTTLHNSIKTLLVLSTLKTQ